MAEEEPKEPLDDSAERTPSSSDEGTEFYDPATGDDAADSGASDALEDGADVSADGSEEMAPAGDDEEAADADTEASDTEGLLSPEDLEELVALEAEAQAEEARGGESEGGAGASPRIETPESIETESEASTAQMESAILGDDEIGQMVEDTMERQAEALQADGDYSVGNAGDIVSALEEPAELDLDGLLEESGLDAPVLEKGEADATVPAEAVAEEDELSEAFLEALISSAGAEAPHEDIGSENLAAAATSPAPEEGTPLAASEEDELDALIAKAQAAPEAEAAPTEAPAPEAAPPVAPVKLKTPREPLELPWMKITAAGMAGLIAAGMTFYALLGQRTEVPPMEVVLEGGLSDLQTAMDRARLLMEGAEYERAVSLLNGALERNPTSPLWQDGAYLRTEAMVAALPSGNNARYIEGLHQEIDQLLSIAPRHARAPEAQYWKAQLHLLEDMPYAANEIFENLARHHGTMPGFDRVLREAAALALDLRDPKRAAEYSQRLLNQFPESIEGSRARLLLARAYAMAGMDRDARTLFIRAAQSDPDPNIRGEAIRHLGQLNFDEGDYRGAIRELDTFLKNTLSTEGNDEAYLLLARSQHAAGEGASARETLNDLLQFFPESAVTPQAFLELSQVHESLGERQAALRVAQQAAIRYPENGEILAHLGAMLGLVGNPLDAANALVAAEAAGRADPRLLLVAARQFRVAGEQGKALETYERLQRRYITFPEAFEGGVEAARVLHEIGEVPASLDRLESLLQSASRDDDRLLAATTAMRIYHDLGFHDRVAELAADLGGLSADPEDLAEAALALLEAGAVREGRELIDRIGLASLPASQAYTVLSRLGAALLEIDPRRALQHMEDAYLTYPRQRTLPNDLKLLEAYLLAGRTAAARRMVSEIEARVEASPVDTAYYVEAVMRWGDHLFDAGDFRMAADAYARALEAAERLGQTARSVGRDPRWAEFQRANALMALFDYQRSLELFNQIAASDSPWAADAAVKAEQARLEQRLRGGGTTARTAS